MNFCDLQWPFEVILLEMKYLRIHNISIHINFYQNRFINECARKIKAKIPESYSFRFFLWNVEELTFLKSVWIKLFLFKLDSMDEQAAAIRRELDARRERVAMMEKVVFSSFYIFLYKIYILLFFIFEI